MGSAFRVVLDPQTTGFDTEVEGRGLVASEEVLTRAAERLGVRPLHDFLGSTRMSWADENGEEVYEDEDEDNLPWFAPEDGLRTVRALLRELERDNRIFGDGVRRDLLQFEEVLYQAKKQRCRWRLAPAC